MTPKSGQKTSQNEPEDLDRAIDVAAAMAVIGTLNKTENFSEKIIQWIGKELMMESFAGQELFRGLFREEFEIELKEKLNEFKKQAAEREKQLELQAREKEKQAAERERKLAAKREKELELQARERERLAKELSEKNRTEQERQAKEQLEQTKQEHFFRMFSKRFGEPLTEKEKKLIVLHLEFSGADELYDAVLKHDNKEDLRNWLKHFE